MSYGHDDHDHGHHHQDSHWGPHDWEFDYGHGVVGGAPHNSWAPIMIALGSSLFLLGYTKVFTQSWNDADNGQCVGVLDQCDYKYLFYMPG